VHTCIIQTGRRDFVCLTAAVVATVHDLWLLLGVVSYCLQPTLLILILLIMPMSEPSEDVIIIIIIIKSTQGRVVNPFRDLVISLDLPVAMIAITRAYQLEAITK
jgi:hypothetical protein